MVANHALLALRLPEFHLLGRDRSSQHRSASALPTHLQESPQPSHALDCFVSSRGTSTHFVKCVFFLFVPILVPCISVMFVSLFNGKVAHTTATTTKAKPQHNAAHRTTVPFHPTTQLSRARRSRGGPRPESAAEHTRGHRRALRHAEPLRPHHGRLRRSRQQPLDPSPTPARPRSGLPPDPALHRLPGPGP